MDLMGLVPILLLAEGEGFEPPEVLPSMVFKTTAIGRSAIPPHDVGRRYCQSGEPVNRQPAGVAGKHSPAFV